MFKNPKDFYIYNSSGTSKVLQAIAADENYIYGVTSAPAFKLIQNTLGQQMNTDLTVVSSPAAITMITTATAAIFSSSTNQVDFVGVLTNDKTSVTTNATTVYTVNQGQMADSTGGIALACRAAAGGLLKATSAQVLTNMTVSALSGLQAKSILAEPSSGVWFVGTNNGKVLTVDSSGNLQNTITIPSTPAILAPTIVVSGLSFSYPYLLVATNVGQLHLFNYQSQTEVDRTLSSLENSSTSFQSLCTASSGFTICARVVGGQNATTIESIYFGNGKIYKEDVVIAEQSTSFTGCVRTSVKAIVFTSASNFAQLRTYDATSSAVGIETTESQNPVGTDVSARVIRILSNGLGKKSVYSDQVVSASIISLPGVEDHDYIELSIVNGNLWDIREFTT